MLLWHTNVVGLYAVSALVARLPASGCVACAAGSRRESSGLGAAVRRPDCSAAARKLDSARSPISCEDCPAHITTKLTR